MDVARVRGKTATPASFERASADDFHQPPNRRRQNKKETRAISRVQCFHRVHCHAHERGILHATLWRRCHTHEHGLPGSRCVGPRCRGDMATGSRLDAAEYPCTQSRKTCLSARPCFFKAAVNSVTRNCRWLLEG